jgi:hypothetical protein
MSPLKKTLKFCNFCSRLGLNADPDHISIETSVKYCDTFCSHFNANSNPVAVVNLEVKSPLLTRGDLL